MELQSFSYHKESELSGNIYELASKHGIFAGIQYMVDEATSNASRMNARRRVQLSREFASRFYTNNHVRQSEQITLRDCIKSSLRVMEEEGLYPHELFAKYLENIAENYSPHGFTAAQEIINNVLKVASDYSKKGANKRLSLDLLYLWSPVFSPGTNRYDSEQQEYSDFCDIFDIPIAKAPEYFRRGQVGKCDFLICFKSDDFVYLSVIEFSHKYDTYFYQLEGDVEIFDIHRRKQGAYNSSKGGIFNFINEDIYTSSFKISEIHKDTNLATYYTDKSFMKLAQAAAYADSAIKLIRTKFADVKIYVDIQSMLNLENAQVVRGFVDSPIESMISSMAELYRKDKTVTDSIEDYHKYVTQELEAHIQAINPDIREKINTPLSQSIQSGEYTYDICYEEQINGLNMTNNRKTIEELYKKIKEPPLAARTYEHMLKKADQNKTVTYREAHAAAIIASLELAPRGEISLLGLVGNAGIGKTTAFSTFLKNTDFGWFGIYSSCRVTINKDVLQSISQESLRNNLRICCLTTNSKHIKAASKYAESCLENYNELKQNKQHIDSSIIVGGLPLLSVYNGGYIQCFGVEDIHTAIFSRQPNAGRKGILLLNSHADGDIELDRHTDRAQYKTTTISKTQEMVYGTAPAGVFKTLMQGYQRIMEQNPEIKKTLMCLATQAFKFNNQGDSPLIELKNIIYGGDDVELETKIDLLYKFAQRQSDIYVMLDEITGDEDGVGLALSTIQALQQVFIAPFREAGLNSPFKVVVLLADASLASPDSMKNYLCSGDNSARVSVYDTDSDGVDFKVTKDILPVVINMRYETIPIVYVETNTYPAPNLKIRNRMVLGRDVRDDLDLSVRLSPSRENPEITTGYIDNMSSDAAKSRKSNVFSRSVSIAIDEIAKAIGVGGFSHNHQVIYFSQNRNELDGVKQGLILEGIVSIDEIIVITSSTPPVEKQKALNPHSRDAIKVILMTSAASRGLSFPKATTIISNIPDFNIETQLMEVMQVAYRGRGSYTDALGHTLYGDSLDKQLVYLVNDEMLVEKGLIDVDLAMNSTSLWFKKTRDMLMILALVKACLLSRINGNAGLKKPCMIIPIGPSSDKKLRESGFAEKLNELNKELSNMILSGGDDEKLLGISIQNRLLDVFCSANYRFVPAQMGGGEKFTLYSDIDFIKIKEKIIWSLDKPIFTANRQFDSNIRNLEFIGDLVIQKIVHRGYEEVVEFSLDGQERREAYNALKNTLSGMLMSEKDGLRISGALRSAIGDVRKLMERQHSFGGSYDLTQKTSRVNTCYIIWPLNVHHFWHQDQKVSYNNSFNANLDLELVNMAWHTALKQPLGLGVARPLLPFYKYAPFIVTFEKPNIYGSLDKTRINKTDVLLTTGTNMINLLFLDK